jgi:hypothetical protein
LVDYRFSPAPILHWSEGEGWGISRAEPRLEDCGAKAVGLSKLPDAWGIPWTVIPLSACQLAQSQSRWVEAAHCVLCHFLAFGQNLEEGMIARSSGPLENMDRRGQFDSFGCEAVPKALADAMRQVALQVPAGDSASSTPILSAVVVQPFVKHEYRGHLSNEYRHAQRAVDFLYEIESLAKDRTDPQLKTFRLPRPVATPDPASLLRELSTKTTGEVEPALRIVGAWLAAQNVRGHVEWLIVQGHLRLVQLDPDPLPPKIAPMADGPSLAPLELTSPVLGSAFLLTSIAATIFRVSGRPDRMHFCKPLAPTSPQSSWPGTSETKSGTWRVIFGVS